MTSWLRMKQRAMGQIGLLSRAYKTQDGGSQKEGGINQR